MGKILVKLIIPLWVLENEILPTSKLKTYVVPIRILIIPKINNDNINTFACYSYNTPVVIIPNEQEIIFHFLLVLRLLFNNIIIFSFFFYFKMITTI